MRIDCSIDASLKASRRQGLNADNRKRMNDLNVPSRPVAQSTNIPATFKIELHINIIHGHNPTTICQVNWNLDEDKTTYNWSCQYFYEVALFYRCGGGLRDNE